MDNVDQAAHVIMMCVQDRYSPTRVAECLADNGLITEDLPDPNVFSGAEELEWPTVDGYINLKGGEISVVYDERDEYDYLTEPAPMPGEIRITDTTAGRELAYSILAACSMKDAQDA